MTIDPKTPISKATPQPEGNEPEVEGHWRFKAVEQSRDNDDDEVQGNILRRTDIEQAAQQPEAEDEVQGHKLRYFGTEQAVEQPEDEDDVEGHLVKKV